MANHVPSDRDNTGIGSPAAPTSDGAKSMARRVAQQAGGTGMSGHSGTGAEESMATPGRVSVGSTAGDDLVGGSAIGDEGIGATDGTTATGFGGVGGEGVRDAGGGTDSGTGDHASRGLLDGAGTRADESGRG